MHAITLLIFYVILINAAGFTLMGLDKARARRHAFRVPEVLLFAVALAGGSIGIIAGIWTFRHKSAQRRFVFGVPLILLLQIILVCMIAFSDLQIFFL